MLCEGSFPRIFWHCFPALFHRVGSGFLAAQLPPIGTVPHAHAPQGSTSHHIVKAAARITAAPWRLCGTRDSFISAIIPTSTKHAHVHLRARPLRRTPALSSADAALLSDPPTRLERATADGVLRGRADSGLPLRLHASVNVGRLPRWTKHGRWRGTPHVQVSTACANRLRVGSSANSRHSPDRRVVHALCVVSAIFLEVERTWTLC